MELLETPLDLWYWEHLAEVHGIGLGSPGQLEQSAAAGERHAGSFEWALDATPFDETQSLPHESIVG